MRSYIQRIKFNIRPGLKYITNKAENEMVDYLFTPKHFNSKELKKVGVKIIEIKERCCKCIECGEKWNVPKLLKGKTLPKDFWKCPNECNTLSLQIRSIGLNWVLWELPDGTTFVGKFDKIGRVRLSELEEAAGEIYHKLNKHLEDGGDPLSIGLDWDIHELDDGTVYVAENFGNKIYTLKPASKKIKKIYKNGKGNQFSVAGDLGMHT